jgi:hypothetical protein
VWVQEMLTFDFFQEAFLEKVKKTGYQEKMCLITINTIFLEYDVQVPCHYEFTFSGLVSIKILKTFDCSAHKVCRK